jgi:hypothetical protein
LTALENKLKMQNLMKVYNEKEKIKKECRKVALKGFFALSFCPYIHQLEHKFPTA